jgi:hypothetical protein
MRFGAPDLNRLDEPVTSAHAFLLRESGSGEFVDADAYGSSGWHIAL